MKTDQQPSPRLIEVALPIREISAESVRDKSLRHGHISTLHLWWARRPLAESWAEIWQRWPLACAENADRQRANELFDSPDEDSNTDRSVTK